MGGSGRSCGGEEGLPRSSPQGGGMPAWRGPFRKRERGPVTSAAPRGCPSLPRQPREGVMLYMSPLSCKWAESRGLPLWKDWEYHAPRPAPRPAAGPTARGDANTPSTRVPAACARQSLRAPPGRGSSVCMFTPRSDLGFEALSGTDGCQTLENRTKAFGILNFSEVRNTGS